MDCKNWPSGLKHTRQRGQVMELLEKAEKPLSAVDIAKEAGAISLSTVYRILDSFEDCHLVEKITLPSCDTAFYKLSSGTHTHYATCLSCHKQIPLSFCPIEELKLVEDNEEFTITGHKLELYGYCRECREKMQNKTNEK